MSAVAAVLVVAAVALQGLAVVGVVLLPDALDRIHLLAPGGLAGLLVFAAILVQEGPSLIALSAGLTAGLLLSTGPVVGYALGRATHRRRGEGHRS